MTRLTDSRATATLRGRGFTDRRDPERYGDFFALFGDFRGYVDFFLFQDLVTPEYDVIRFFSSWAALT